MLKALLIGALAWAFQRLLSIIEEDVIRCVQRFPEFVIRVAALVQPSAERATRCKEMMQEQDDEREDLGAKGMSPRRVWSHLMRSALAYLAGAPRLAVILDPVRAALPIARAIAATAMATMSVLILFAAWRTPDFNLEIIEVSVLVSLGLFFLVQVARWLAEASRRTNLSRFVTYVGSPLTAGSALILLGVWNSSDPDSSVVFFFAPGVGLVAAALCYVAVPLSVRPWLGLLPLVPGCVAFAVCLWILRGLFVDPTTASELLYGLSVTAFIGWLCRRQWLRVREDLGGVILVA